MAAEGLTIGGKRTARRRRVVRALASLPWTCSRARLPQSKYTEEITREQALRQLRVGWNKARARGGTEAALSARAAGS
jgi:hypothetical protein